VFLPSIAGSTPTTSCRRGWVWAGGTLDPTAEGGSPHPQMAAPARESRRWWLTIPSADASTGSNSCTRTSKARRPSVDSSCWCGGCDCMAFQNCRHGSWSCAGGGCCWPPAVQPAGRRPHHLAMAHGMAVCRRTAPVCKPIGSCSTWGDLPPTVTAGRVKCLAGSRRAGRTCVCCRVREHLQHTPPAQMQQQLQSHRRH
jgi:hypothetical protein